MPSAGMLHHVALVGIPQILHRIYVFSINIYVSSLVSIWLYTASKNSNNEIGWIWKELVGTKFYVLA
jgi:hypothetical protein